MEVSMPLSMLIPLLICVASYGLAKLIARRHESIDIQYTVQKESAVQKGSNRCGGPTEARVFMPNVLAKWPWLRRINPNYSVVKKESDAWINSFNAFSPKAQDAFNRCDFDLFACLAHPTARKEHVRAGCDLMHLFETIDDYSDRSAPPEVRMQRGVVLDALRSPHIPRPKGEWVGGEIARQFWELTIQNATTVSQKRFIQYMSDYLDAVVQESTHREDHRILDIKTYIDVRHHTSGTKPSFSIIELGLDIPDEVMSHPTIQEMMLTAGEMVALQNDIYSYSLERHRGDDVHNILTCVMNEHKTDVNGALLWVENYLFGVEERFYAALAALPKWEEPLDSQVKRYCDGLGQWVRANDDWSFEGKKYFGDKGLEIKEKRWMSLLPKGHSTEIGPVNVDSSLL